MDLAPSWRHHAEVSPSGAWFNAVLLRRRLRGNNECPNRANRGEDEQPQADANNIEPAFLPFWLRFFFRKRLVSVLAKGHRFILSQKRGVGHAPTSPCRRAPTRQRQALHRSSMGLCRPQLRNLACRRLRRPRSLPLRERGSPHALPLPEHQCQSCR